MSESAPRYEILGQTVTLPCHVGEAGSLAASFLVDAREARRRLPSPELDVVELLPGRAMFSVACVDYRQNDLGRYHEIALALFVRERRAGRRVPYLGAALDLLRGRLATCILHLPVDEAFTCEAGRRIWGFPKTVDRLEFSDQDGRRSCRWEKDGRHVLSFEAPIEGRARVPEQSMVTYSVLEGALHATRFVSRAERVGFCRSKARLSLGDHPVADDLRALGISETPMFCVSMGHMTARFEAPEKL